MMKAWLGIALAATFVVPAHAGDREFEETVRIVVSDLRDRSQLAAAPSQPAERSAQRDVGSTASEPTARSEPRSVRIVGPSFFPED